jgi:hypothetical protein
VHAADDSLGTARRHLRLRVVLVEDRQVIEDVFLCGQHAAQPILNEDGHLIGVRGVVGATVRNRRGDHVAVAILVLQPFAVERRASGRAADQKSACPHVTSRPDQVADALEAEHGIEREERDHGHAVAGVGRRRGEP